MVLSDHDRLGQGGEESSDFNPSNLDPSFGPSDCNHVNALTFLNDGERLFCKEVSSS
jgi:hypothetical protein